MVNSNNIYNSYINLYKNLRNYIWSINTVKKIAELEVECCTRIQNIEQVKKCLDSLCKDIKVIDDEDLLSSMNNLYDVINESNKVFYEINFVNEVIV